MCTLTLDPRSSALMGSARVTQKLYDVLCDKRDDVEIVLQLVYLFYKLVYHESSRHSVVQHERLVSCILDLVVDPNEKICLFANLCVDVIMEHSDEWQERILERRFATCNYYWLQFLQGNNPFDEEEVSVQDRSRAEDFNLSGDYYDQFADYSGWDPSHYEQMEQMHTMINDRDVNDYDLHEYT